MEPLLKSYWDKKVYMAGSKEKVEEKAQHRPWFRSDQTETRYDQNHTRDNNMFLCSDKATVHRSEWDGTAKDDSSVSVETIDAAIKSNMMWASISAVLDICGEAEHIGRWCEGCPCHSAVEASGLALSS